MHTVKNIHIAIIHNAVHQGRAWKPSHDCVYFLVARHCRLPNNIGKTCRKLSVIKPFTPTSKRAAIPSGYCFCRIGYRKKHPTSSFWLCRTRFTGSPFTPCTIPLLFVKLFPTHLMRLLRFPDCDYLFPRRFSKIDKPRNMRNDLAAFFHILMKIEVPWNVIAFDTLCSRESSSRQVAKIAASDSCAAGDITRAPQHNRQARLGATRFCS